MSVWVLIPLPGNRNPEIFSPPPHPPDTEKLNKFRQADKKP